MGQKVWRKEDFKRLKAISFTIFVGNLPEHISNKELHHSFGWTGKINDIYISRKIDETRSTAEFGVEVAGESERIATNLKGHCWSLCVRIQAWAARPIADLGIYAYAYEASMCTHRSIPASIDR
ncbi:hypothetical protein PIB30_011082 [Stylosanthes scabra]|uniref:RRM domain-containing protein n=1 Tax=Stylosanthes scabra TaxID=79078 RepID=A0ABU6Y3T1_9FABA|nr:hypothetical protein [Stylosanthes scabra]